jgi:ribosomal protein L37AE/L43A
VPDTPRYKEAQVHEAIRQHKIEPSRYSLDSSPRSANCNRDHIRYAGNGIWTCGAWAFDEQTGIVFRNRAP